jgi:hypothetical protein
MCEAIRKIAVLRPIQAKERPFLKNKLRLKGWKCVSSGRLPSNYESLSSNPITVSPPSKKKEFSSDYIVNLSKLKGLAKFLHNVKTHVLFTFFLSMLFVTFLIIKLSFTA